LIQCFVKNFVLYCVAPIEVKFALYLLLLFSGEGTLSAFDIRKHKLLLQSELLDSGLLSVAVVKVNGFLILYTIVCSQR